MNFWKLLFYLYFPGAYESNDCFKNTETISVGSCCSREWWQSSSNRGIYHVYNGRRRLYYGSRRSRVDNEKYSVIHFTCTPAVYMTATSIRQRLPLYMIWQWRLSVQRHCAIVYIGCHHLLCFLHSYISRGQNKICVNPENGRVIRTFHRLSLFNYLTFFSKIWKLKIFEPGVISYLNDEYWIIFPSISQTTFRELWVPLNICEEILDKLSKVIHKCSHMNEWMN